MAVVVRIARIGATRPWIHDSDGSGGVVARLDGKIFPQFSSNFDALSPKHSSRSLDGGLLCAIVRGFEPGMKGRGMMLPRIRGGGGGGMIPRLVAPRTAGGMIPPPRGSPGRPSGIGGQGMIPPPIIRLVTPLIMGKAGASCPRTSWGIRG